MFSPFGSPGWPRPIRSRQPSSVPHSSRSQFSCSTISSASRAALFSACSLPNLFVGGQHAAPFLAKLIRYFTYVATQFKNVLYQNCAFCCFSTQCPSSAKTTTFHATPSPYSALTTSPALVNSTLY